MAITKRIERKLVCELSELELKMRSASLADTVRMITATNSARAAATKEFKERLDGLAERQLELADAIENGTEQRIVACVVNFHAPVEASKQIIRLDTGELVSEEPMSAEECQTKIWHEPAELDQAAPADVAELAEQIVDAGLVEPVLAVLRECDAESRDEAPDPNDGGVEEIEQQIVEVGAENVDE
jgi:hypothetical protein